MIYLHSQLSSKGFSLLEVILAVSLLALFVVGFAGAWLYGEEAAVLSGNRARALLLAEEGLEASRAIRDGNFSNLTIGAHGLATSSGQWVYAGTSDVKGQFTRSVVVSTVDTRRKAVSSTVTWQQNKQRTGSVTIATRLTEWARIVTSWVTPLRVAVVDQAGVTNSTKVEVLGNYAYVIRSGAVQDFVVYDVSNPSAPSLVSQLSLGGNTRNMYISGTLAYIATDSNTQELQIISIANPLTPVVVGSYNDAGSDNATGIFVAGSVAYITFDSGNEFVTVNVSNPAAPSALGALNLSGIPFEIAVLGTNAYLATNSNGAELMVINVASPLTPTLTTSFDLPGNQDGLSITGFGSTIALGRASGGGLALVSILTPSAPSVLGTFASTADINDVALGNSNAYVFAATADLTSEFKVVNIATPATPTLVGSFNNAGTSDGVLSGVVYHAAQDRAYAVGASDVAEFLVYAPQ